MSEYFHELLDEIGRCWFWHNWTHYRSYEYDSDIDSTLFGNLTCSGLLDYIPSLQIRTCERCGKEERHDFRHTEAKVRPK